MRSEVEMVMKKLIDDETIIVRVSLWVRMNTVKEQVR